MGGDGSDLNGASREGNGATSVAAAKTDEAGLEFLPVFESPPPPPTDARSGCPQRSRTDLAGVELSK